MTFTADLAEPLQFKERAGPGAESRLYLHQDTHPSAVVFRIDVISVFDPPGAGVLVKLHPPPAHMQVDQYGNFRLTEAVRPAPEQGVIPRQGYRLDSYHDISAGVNVPVLAAAISRDAPFRPVPVNAPAAR